MMKHTETQVSFRLDEEARVWARGEWAAKPRYYIANVIHVRISPDGSTRCSFSGKSSTGKPLATEFWPHGCPVANRLIREAKRHVNRMVL